jgi:hypothetical protein
MNDRETELGLPSFRIIRYLFAYRNLHSSYFTARYGLSASVMKFTVKEHT